MALYCTETFLHSKGNNQQTAEKICILEGENIFKFFIQEKVTFQIIQETQATQPEVIQPDF